MISNNCAQNLRKSNQKRTGNKKYEIKSRQYSTDEEQNFTPVVQLSEPDQAGPGTCLRPLAGPGAGSSPLCRRLSRFHEVDRGPEAGIVA